MKRLFSFTLIICFLATALPVQGMTVAEPEKDHTLLLPVLAGVLIGVPIVAITMKDEIKSAMKKVKAVFRGGKSKKKGSQFSAEENRVWVTELYRRVLQRKPDAGGLANWCKALDDGTRSRKQVEEEFYASEEYRKRFGGKKPTVSTGSKPDSSGGRTDGGSDSKPGDKGTLDDLLGGKPTAAGGENAAGENQSRTFSFWPKESGVIEFETSGIQHQDKPCINGDWEYIFFTMNGEGMNRLLLLHAGGNGRKIRYVLQGGGTDTMRMEIASDNLPDWHKWTVKWGSGQLQVFLDGKQIGRTEKFAGAKPTSCIVGGNQNSRRNFLGKWRNFSVK